MYHECIIHGMSIDEFWKLSMDEVELFLKSKIEQKKDRVIELQALANIIVSAAFYDDKSSEKPITVYDIYAPLFEEDRRQMELEQQQAQTARHKAQMTMYMLRHNKTKAGGDD